MEHGELLAGGNMNEVRRFGATVRRSAGPWTPTIHAVLRWLEACGVPFTPRVRGIDKSGAHETLTYIAGTAALYPLSVDARSDEVLRQVGTMLRRYHDATRGFAIPDGAVWRDASLISQPLEVICHNDVSPHNVILQERQVVGLIDFDHATPGSRVWDFANTASRFACLTDDVQARIAGWDDPPDRTRRLRLLLDSYQPEFGADELAETIILRTRRNRDGQAGAGGLPDHLLAYERELAWHASNLSTTVAAAYR